VETPHLSQTSKKKIIEVKRMNIEEIRADIFKLFDIRVDKDDPIWAFLYANREVIRQLEDLLELSKKENKEYYRQLKLDLEEFKKVAKDSVLTAVEQFDFRIDEFNRDLSRMEKHHQDVISYHNRFKSDTQKSCDEKLERLSGLFDSNILAIEQRINSIISAIDYTRFSDNIEREVDGIVKRSLQEIRAGVSINNKAMEKLREINDEHEIMTKKLNSRVSTLTTLGIIQSILFGASLTFIAMIYFSQGNLKFPSFEKHETKSEVQFKN
jgi:hypothetical protein